MKLITAYGFDFYLNSFIIYFFMINYPSGSRLLYDQKMLRTHVSRVQIYFGKAVNLNIFKLN